MKRALSVIFIVIILSFGAVITAPSFIDLNAYKSKAIDEVKQRTGFELSLNGNLDFSIFPAPRFIAKDISIASPEGSKNANLLSFDRLDVNIELMPLFKGQVLVSSITLNKPVIALEMFKNGSLNILTKELQNIEDEGGSSSSSPNSAFDISLDNIRIKDGSFSYFDHKTKSSNSIQNINLDLSAKSLTGPFQAQGSMFYDGHALNLDFTSEAYDTVSKVLPSKLRLEVSPIGAIIKYAGAINFADAFSAQGQTTIELKNIEQLNLPLQVKGLLSITEKNIDYKDFNMRLGDNEFGGTLRLDIAPFKYLLSLKSISDIGLAQHDFPFDNASVSLNIVGDMSSMKIKNSSIKMDRNIFKISGNVNHKKGLSGSINISVADIYALAKSLDIDLSSLPPNNKFAKITTNFSGSFDKMNISADISALGAKIHAKITQSGQKYSLKDIKASMLKTSVKGQLDIDLGAKIPKIKGDLVFGDISINSVMQPQQSSNNKAQKPSSTKIAARWSKEHLNVAALHLLNADISLVANKIEYGAWSLLKPSLKLILNDGTLKISDLKAGVFGGTIAMNSNIITVAKPRQPIHVKSNITVENADLGRLSKAMLGGTQIVRISGKGGLLMDIKSSGASPAALIHDLSGSGSVNGYDLILDGVDVTRFARALSEESRVGDSVLGLWNGASKGGQSAFDTLDGAFVINQGVVQIDKMTLDGAASSIQTKGNINLPNWTLATKHKITVKGSDIAPSDVPPFEVSFSGSLDNPAQTFGQGLLDDYLKRKIQRKLNKFLSDKLGSPSNDNDAGANNTKQPQQNAAPAPTAEDEIEDVIKDVLGDLLR